MGIDGVESVGEVRADEMMGEERVDHIEEVDELGGLVAGEIRGAVGESSGVGGDGMEVIMDRNEQGREGDSIVGSGEERTPAIWQNASTSKILNVEKSAIPGESATVTPTQSMLFGGLGLGDDDDGAGPGNAEERPSYTDDESSDAGPEAQIALLEGEVDGGGA